MTWEEICLGIAGGCLVSLAVMGFVGTLHPAPKPSISYCATHGLGVYTWHGTDYFFKDRYMPCKWLNLQQDI